MKANLLFDMVVKNSSKTCPSLVWEGPELYPLAVVKKHAPSAVVKKRAPSAVVKKHAPSAVVKKHAPSAVISSQFEILWWQRQSSIFCLLLAVKRSSNLPLNLVWGTIRYMAPEILAGTIDLRFFDSFLQADVYSLGFVLWDDVRTKMVSWGFYLYGFTCCRVCVDTSAYLSCNALLAFSL